MVSLPVDGAVLEIESDHTSALSILHEQIHCEVLDEVIAVVAQRLSIKRVQKGVAGSDRWTKG